MATVIGKSKRHTKECECFKCASIVEYTLSEVKEYVEHDYAGGKDLVKYIDCPGCSRKIKVKGY